MSVTSKALKRICGAVLALLLTSNAMVAQTDSPAPATAKGNDSLEPLLDRAAKRVTEFLDLFSNVKCVEQVTQQKIKPDGKVELSEQSSYDYLVILTNSGGDLSLDESRLPIKQAKADQKKNISMLLSNGFATLFLVFHPYYSSGFEFTDAGPDTVNGHNARKIHFEHIHNTRTIAALALRGREYPLEISGNAWIDPTTGDPLRIEAGIGDTLEDIGMKSLQSQVTFAPIVFQKGDPAAWLPVEAIVEVETPKQHWRNTHHFADYRKFSVSTEEQVATK